MNLNYFSELPLYNAGRQFFQSDCLIPSKEVQQSPVPLSSMGLDNKKETEFIKNAWILGLVDDEAFGGSERDENALNTLRDGKGDYPGIVLVAIELLDKDYSRGFFAQITRYINRHFKSTPVAILFRYNNMLTFANIERTAYQQTWREGEKVGKVTTLKDIRISQTHAAHERILLKLQINSQKVNSFIELYNYWQSVFSIQALNDQFYEDLQNWFYFASQNIKLPFKPDYVNEKENIKNFLVRLLARTLFCWFVKEKGLIDHELLELSTWDNKKFKLTADIDSDSFLQSNSYYRGILQNIFFSSLNQKEKSSIRNFKWTKYLNNTLNISKFTEIPYLNGGIFDILEEDNAKESIEDSVIKIPNFLFYGIEVKEERSVGRGSNKRTELVVSEKKGLNQILKSYKFTLDENTPLEEDIALDPEMLGLVFENLLAELDSNLEESTVKSIRKLTGSYYTPRKVIYEMVNDSLSIYLNNFISDNYSSISNIKESVNNLVYNSSVDCQNKDFCYAVVHALDKFRMLDPACGSGAFPMGMLHRMVDILKLVDDSNELWVELKLKNVDSEQKTQFKKLLTTHLDNYSRKLGIIRDSIYGIDIQPMAVQITKLRFFISLLIDQKTEKGITPMPNIETKIICADSLKSVKYDMFASNEITKLAEARNRYYQTDTTPEVRERIANEIVDILDVVFPSFSFQITGKRIEGQNKALLKHWFTHGTIAAPFFNMEFFFPELTVSGGFDCVIGNPPYGGFKISDDVRETLDIESKDPYGAFIARFLSYGINPTPLKHKGVLAYIVSDTFMTIKSHWKLRRQIMDNYVHKMIRMHPDTFRATVNTVVMIAERNVFPLKREGSEEREYNFNENHICLMADMTNISINDNYDKFMQVLSRTRGIDFSSENKNISNEEYAVYFYPQNLINSNSNLPFFVASPKLFALMNDSGKDLKKETKEIGGKQIQVRKILMNGKEVKVVKLGDIAEVKVGLQTGDNNAYLFQKPEARGTYRNINFFKKFLLDEADLDKIRNNENLRLAVIDKGISINNPKSERYFEGRYIIPHDKGGESESDTGWMPNYFVPTDYFIDWQEETAFNLINGLCQYENSTQPYARNRETYFLFGITFSTAGVYAPTFRIGSGSVYGHRGSTIFSLFEDPYFLLGLLSSKFVKYQIKNNINHSVANEAGTFDLVSIIFNNKTAKINDISKIIITNQKSNPRYDYASHEQIEIDKLVYEAYGLNAEDVLEVENWYARRYPKLSAAQKANLRALGKSDDYLVLYGLK